MGGECFVGVQVNQPFKLADAVEKALAVSVAFIVEIPAVQPDQGRHHVAELLVTQFHTAVEILHAGQIAMVIRVCRLVPRPHHFHMHPQKLAIAVIHRGKPRGVIGDVPDAEMPG